MNGPRLFQSTDLHVDQNLELDSQASVHVARVLRLRVGDPVVVFNGRGGEYHGRLHSVDKRRVCVSLERFDVREVESPLAITLVQGISRGERMDYTVQKAVELGVARIIPVLTKRSTVNLDLERAEKRRSHWQSIVQSACEQSGRNQIPEVQAVQRLDHWLRETGSVTGGKWILYHRAEATVVSSRETAATLLVGPEGGWDPQEIELATDAGFTPVCFGPRILRTETAALVALSILQRQWGDL